jgi:hypothetical protein
VTIVNAINLTISGFVTGSDVVVYEAGTSTVLDDAQDVVGTSWDFIYEGASVGTSVDVGVFKAGYRPYYIRGYTLGASDASLPVSQTVDRDYIV